MACKKIEITAKFFSTNTEIILIDLGCSSYRKIIYKEL